MLLEFSSSQMNFFLSGDQSELHSVRKKELFLGEFTYLSQLSAFHTVLILKQLRKDQVLPSPATFHHLRYV